MNKIRRNSLYAIMEGIQAINLDEDYIEIQQSIEALQSDLMAVCDEEEMTFDNLSEGLQSTARAQSMQDAIDSMNYADDELNDAIDILDTMRAGGKDAEDYDDWKSDVLSHLNEASIYIDSATV